MPPPKDTLIGVELVGRYKIERKLGEGGMGSVYVARHMTLDKQVAIKILHGEYARKPDLIERFLQEAKAASKIRHENVIDITDFGTTGDGLVFFCMELLGGQDLHELLTTAKIEGEKLPWSRTGPIFLQVCAALQAAHDNGIIHRDLKPENIFLINWLGSSDFVKLLDFGIAKMTEVDGSDGDRKLTKTGMLFGTPEYMSPEQARGDKPDARVDVYAMGCILYQLITGSTPFSGDSFMAVLSQHLTAEPPVLTAEALAEVGAPPGLTAVVARTLVKDRDQRYPSVKALADAVREAEASRASAAHQVVAPPITQPEPTTDSEWTGEARPEPAPPSDTVRPGTQHRAKTARTLWLMVAAVVIIGGGAVGAIALSGSGKDKGATDRETVEESAPVNATSPDLASPPATAPTGEPETRPASIGSGTEPATGMAPDTTVRTPPTAPRETADPTSATEPTRARTDPEPPPTPTSASSDPDPEPTAARDPELKPDPKPDPKPRPKPPDDEPKPGEVQTKNPFD